MSFTEIPRSKQGRQLGAYLAWVDASGANSTLIFDVVESEEWQGDADVTESPVEAGVNITDHVRPKIRRVTLKVFASNEPIKGSQWGNALPGPSTIQIDGRPRTPWSQVMDVPQWNSHLRERILAGTAAGLLGGAVGGALGNSAVGGAIGAAAGGALAGALLAGTVEHNPTDVDAGLTPLGTQTFTTQSWQWGTDEGDFVQQTILLLEELKDAAQTIDVFGTKTVCVGTGGLGGMVIEALTHVRTQGEGTGASITIGLRQIRVATTTTVPAPKASLPTATAPKAKGNQEGSELGDAASQAADSFVKGFAAGKSDVAALLGGP